MAIHPVRLDPVDLTSKWGFGDGDMFSDTIDEWYLSSDWKSIHPVQDSWEMSYFSHRLLLREAVYRHLVPQLPNDLASSVCHVNTSHNPVRVFVDLDQESIGEDEYSMLEDALQAKLANLPSVVIEPEMTAAICEDLFPIRPRGWMAMYEAMVFPSIFDIALPPTGSDRDSWDVHYRLRPYLDELAQDYSDEELFLAAELFSTTQRPTITDVRRTLNAANKVLR